MSEALNAPGISRMKRVASAALFAVLCGLQTGVANEAWADGMRRETLVLTTSTGRAEISTEIALTPPEQAQGMMFRTGMADSDGMLFVYAQPQVLNMWMHNTYLSLDMVFVAANGTVVRIESNAEPLSDRVISSRSPATAVLELKAGTALRLGLKPGDRVESPSLRTAAP